MSTIVELLSSLREKGVGLSLDGDSLRCNAPKGVLTSELKTELGARKQEILRFLRSAREASVTGGASMKRIDRKGRLPLSFAQQRLWFLNQLDEGSSAYNLSAPIRLTGHLDVVALQRALSGIVRRHEDLRSCFIQQDGTPCVVIQDGLDWRLSEIDLQGVELEIREQVLMSEGAELSRAPFDLSKGPLFRATLLKVGAEQHVLVLSMHHIISDGWSMGVFIRELAQFYPAALIGKEPQLSPLAIQYVDFAEWQRNWLENGELDRQLPYWKKQLAGAPPVVIFPPDRQRPAVESFRGKRSLLKLDKDLVSRLNEFSRGAGVTLFMTLLSAFNVLLSRYSGQKDVVVGSPSANRSREEVHGLIGFFVNNLVLRTNLEGNPTFRELVGRVREGTLMAYEHQDVPFEKLVQALKPERTMGYSPLFQTLFIFQNFTLDDLELAGLKVQPVELELGIARFDLTVEIYPRHGELQAYFEYNTDLYDDGTIAAIQQHFVAIMNEVMANPDQRIESIPILSFQEEKEISQKWNGTEKELSPGICLHHRFEARVSEHPDYVAVTSGEVSLTYQGLNRRADQIALQLQLQGVGQETLVGVFLDRSTDLLASLLAVMKAGAAYIPLDPIYPKQRIAGILEDARPKIILTLSTLVDLLPESSAGLICLDHLGTLEESARIDNLTVDVCHEDLAYVIFTSGSTGKPKGVQISHGALMNFLESMSQQPGFTEYDNLLAITTISFDIAGLEMFLPLFAGGRVHIAKQPGDIESLLRDIELTRPTMMQATPATWQMLLSAGWRGDPALKILCGGEAWDSQLARSLKDRGQSVWNMYGPTETTIWSAAWRVEATAGEKLHVGLPIQNTSFHVLDEHGQTVPFGVTGELFIGGSGLARGYFNRSDLTEERFVPDFFSTKKGSRLYRTGDLVRLRTDGLLDFLGRSDHQVKLRGFRIELGEIEHAIRQLAEIKDTAVILREEDGDKRLVAYMLSSHKRPSPATIRNALREVLPEYMVPAEYMFLDEFPRTPNGKFDRNALPAPPPKMSDAQTEFAAPQSDVESAIAAIFCELLNLRQVSVQDNFFDLGAHSMMIVKAHERLKSGIAPGLSLVNLFQYPTIEALAAHLGQVRSSLSVSTLDRVL